MIREARTADVPAVVELEALTQGVDAWSENLVRDGIEGGLPTISYLVAEDDGIQGYAVASYAGDIAELQRIGVAEDARRRGLATALLDEVVAHAPSTGADRMLLEVRADNTGALSFYAARGFVEIDRRPRYYRDGTDAVVMRLPLVAGCGGRA
ncbi:GNAT family N-acetyltransferase [Nocardioides marmorisolisilvae]|uniref:GNAT family N-acetyltransferase n=1 Tax=Nocardioides marmorisolisilvae TaxID=1542737 RepID=A0A3N0DZP5_9ACTN|nr:GNAT family N-acetyltransferase [Nocardioides marmorisolisilvae]RNL80963.1 GNAT family N-acetyltransferase [Nocardioides marmorisolisilvae]